MWVRDEGFQRAWTPGRGRYSTRTTECAPSSSSSPSLRRQGRPGRRLLVLMMRPFRLVPFRLPRSRTCSARVAAFCVSTKYLKRVPRPLLAARFVLHNSTNVGQFSCKPYTFWYGKSRERCDVLMWCRTAMPSCPSHIPAVKWASTTPKILAMQALHNCCVAEPDV